MLLVLTSNRGLAGAYNGNVLRVANARLLENQTEGTETTMEVAGKRGINFFRFRRRPVEATYTQFEDRPQYEEVEALAEKYIKLYVQGTIDRLDVAYTQFVSSSRQVATVQTLLPITTADIGQAGPSVRQAKPAAAESPAPERKGGASPLRVPARPPQHPRGDRPGLVQGPAVQVLPRRRRERADRADGGDGRGDQERR